MLTLQTCILDKLQQADYNFQNDFHIIYLKIFHRLESYGIWSTSKRAEYKKRGYIEVRALLPAKTNGQSLKGAWPAIWMLGKQNGHYWPKYGEIDMGKH